MFRRFGSWLFWFLLSCWIAYLGVRAIAPWLFSSPHAQTPAYPMAPSAAAALQPTVSPATTPRDQHWEAMKLLTEAAVAHQSAREESERWANEIEPLRTDSSGDVVAANKDLVEKLAHVFGKQRMTEDEMQVLGQQIDQLKNRVETAAGSNESLSAKEMQEIREVHSKATRAHAAWRDSVQQAHAIVVKARMEAQPVTQPSLDEAIEQARAEDTLERLDKEIASGTSSTPASESATESAGDSIDPDLRKKALSAEVRGLLAPFLEPRTKHPVLRGVGIVNFTKTFEKQPMSYGQILRSGALEESVTGLRKLAALGSHPLPAPNWSYSKQPNYWSDEDTDRLKRAQQMLRDYGQILVDEGLLSQ